MFYTEGSIDALDWYDRGVAAMSDFGNYRLWAPRGIDGNDPTSAKFWENFIDFQFEAPDVMVVVYNLNLGWPLGSKGNKAHFKIDSGQVGNGILRLHIMEKPIGIEDATLSLYGEDSPVNPGTKQVRFQVAIKFGWLLEALMNPVNYGTHMNVIIGIMVNNLRDYSTAATPSPAPTVSLPTLSPAITPVTSTIP